MRRASVLFFVFAVTLSAAACKDDPERPPAASDTGQATGGGSGGGGGGPGGDGGGSSSGGEGGGGDSGAACNALVNDANVIDQNGIVGDPLTGTGGTIADGTYELTTAEVYVGGGGVPGPTGVTYRGVLRITGGQIERVTAVQANQGAAPVE